IEVDAHGFAAVGPALEGVDHAVYPLFPVRHQFENNTLVGRAADMSDSIDRAVAGRVEIVRLGTIAAAGESVNRRFAPDAIRLLQLKERAVSEGRPAHENAWLGTGPQLRKWRAAVRSASEKVKRAVAPVSVRLGELKRRAAAKISSR